MEHANPDASLVFDKASLPTYSLVALIKTLALLNCVGLSDMLRGTIVEIANVDSLLASQNHSP